MCRRLFTLASALSLLLSLATMVLWVRGHWKLDNFETDVRLTEPWGCEVSLGDGRLLGHLYQEPWKQQLDGFSYESVLNVPSELPVIYEGPDSPVVSIVAVTIQAGKDMTLVPFYYILIPYWMLLLMFLILPSFWIWLHLRRCGVHTAHCQVCGYSLTGNTGGVCPECGTPATQQSSMISK